MPRSLHATRFVIASLALHVLLVAVAVLVASRMDHSMPVIMPVNIVNLPRNMLQNLPPVDERPVPRPVTPPPPAPLPPRPEPVPRPESVPTPKRFGSSPDVAVPRTAPPQGLPEGSDKGTSATGKTGAGASPGAGTGTRAPGKGPLPFLSQADIDEFARKGMPARKPGDDSVTLDTDEFKFMSYNRWLKIKVESVLRYPELAAISGFQGTLYIKFDIMKDGSLANLELLRSSGYRILDDEALRAIRSAAPFQPLPDEWSKDRYSIRAAVLFYLNEAYIR